MKFIQILYLLRSIRTPCLLKRSIGIIPPKINRKFSTGSDDTARIESAVLSQKKSSRDLNDNQNHAIKEITKHLDNDFLMRSFLFNDVLNTLESCQNGIKNIDHPICQEIAKSYEEIIEDSNYFVRLPSLISLLYASGVNKSKQKDHDLQRQISVSEVGVVTRSALMFHKDVQTYEPFPETSEKKSLEKCNKMLSLSGDLLCGLSSHMISSLRNCQIMELFSTVIYNGTLEEFIWGDENKNNPKLAYLIGKKQWEERTHLAFSSHMENFTTACLVLTDHDEDSISKAKECVKNIAFSIQAFQDISQFLRFDTMKKSEVDMLSLPVAIHLNSNPDSVLDFFTWGNKKESVDNEMLWNSINKNGSFEETQNAFRAYKKTALNLIQDLPDNKSSQLLANLISSYDS